MSAEQSIIFAIFLPLFGAMGILLASRIGPNFRETVTLVTALGLAITVWRLIPEVIAGGRPGLALVEVVPGIDIAFRIEPLGMMFAALASACGL